MSEGSISGAAPSSPPEQSSVTVSSSNAENSHPSETSSDSHQEMDGQQHILRERPFISSRLSVPNDPVQPRGVNTFSRFAMGYSRNRTRSAFGSGLGMDDELNINQEDSSNSDSGKSANTASDVSQSTEGEGISTPPSGVNFSNFSRRSGSSERGNRPSGRPLSGFSRRNTLGDERSQGMSGASGSNNYCSYGTRGTHSSWRPYNDGNSGGNGENIGNHRNYGHGGSGNRPYHRNTEGYSQYNPAFPELNQSQSHKEPLCLAEELAEEMNRGAKPEEDKKPEILLRDATVGRLQQLSMKELIAEARRFEIGVPDEDTAKKQDVIFSIIKEKIKLNGLLYGEGTLEILPDGFGFLRSTETNYLSCPDDIYVSPSQIRRFGLRNGSSVSGQIRPPKENERYFALLRVEAINFHDPNEFMHRKFFDELTPMHPTHQMKLECGAEEIETRVLDLISPIGFGQRGLLISPKGAGKTTFLTKIARAALKNHPDLYVFLLMVDENSVEVEELRKQVKGLNCEVVSSTLEEPIMRHLQVADMVLEKAKRMVEFRQDVLILVDSITHFARAWYSENQQNRSMDGMYSRNSSQSPKGFFASARAVEEGGSLTILATLESDSEEPVENAIYEEFKGTGNLEIVLDKRLAEQKLWPAIDVNQSVTHCEEMLRTPDEFQAISKLRSFLTDMNPVTAMEMLTKRLGKTQTNEEFLESLN